MIKVRFFISGKYFSGIFKNACKAILIAFIIIVSCDEDPSQLGLQILPDNDNIDLQEIDTITIEAYTVGPEKVPTVRKGVMPIGYFHDPVFGNLEADYLTQLTPIGYKNFGSNLVIDSVFLELDYLDFIGDSTLIPQLEVYNLTSKLDDSVYYSDTDPSGLHDGLNLSVSNTYRPDTTYTVRTVLDNEIGTSMLTEHVDDSSFFLNDTVFDDNFYGFYITTNPIESENILLYVNNTRLVIYYHSDTDTSSYTFYSEFQYFIPDVSVDMFNHDYSGSQIQHLNDFSTQDEKIYVQSLGGTQVILKFPYLDILKDELGQISVNKVEMFIPLADSSNEDELTEYPPPFNLGLRIINDDTEFLPDDIVDVYTDPVTRQSKTINYLNGQYNNDIKGYKFYITGYFRDYFNDIITSNELRLYAAWLNSSTGHSDYRIASLDRVILASMVNPDRKITLKFIYTKL